MIISAAPGGVSVTDFGEINLPLTLDCGQAFRWRKNPDGSFSGVSGGRFTTLEPRGNGLFFRDTAEEDVRAVWVPYFGLDKDYTGRLSEITRDPNVKAAYERYGAIRILNQDPFETLISFIISACNNIPRIKGIVSRLCDCFGGATSGDINSFPTPQTLASLEEKDLVPLRAGFRVPYILGAARSVADGEISLDGLKKLPESEARRELMTLKGVGKKVADCTMLFSLGFENVYPVDRHIERATKELYPGGLPACFDGNRGLAQQYIFYSRID